MHHFKLLVSCLSAALLLQIGCGGTSNAKLRNDLKQTGLAYHLYHDDNQKGPANWEEFLAYAEKSDPVAAASIKRVRDAKYELKWGVKFSELKDGTSNTVMGEAPGGGPKIMMDGSVR
jgi:hypothetical protein